MVSVRNSMASTTSAAGGRAGTGSASPRTDNTLDPTAALPWLHEPLARALGQRRGHALLVHGPEGVGQFEFALALAQAWLCEAAPEQRPVLQRGEGQARLGQSEGQARLGQSEGQARLACGHCAACRLVQGRSHPDLRLIVPEALRAQAGLVSEDEAGEASADGGSKKRKPSREIKVEQIRAALDFSELSGARSGLRVVLIHPAEQINGIAANALLKTLEEPAGDLRFVLSCGAPAALLPTVRSRCQDLRLPLPDRLAASRWLQTELAMAAVDAETLLDACGDQPLAARDLAAAGLGAAAWRDLPAQLLRGDAAGLAIWPLAELVLALQKLAVDLSRLAVGAAPRHFAPELLAPLLQAASGPATAAASADLAARQSLLQGLTGWAAALRNRQRRADHPFSLPLAIEALVIEARQALGLT